MKLAAYLVLACVPALAGAQAYKAPPGSLGGSTPVAAQHPEAGTFQPFGSVDTPTMRRQREIRAAAFRTRVADLLDASNGALTDDTRKSIRREYVRLLRHDR